MMPESNRKANHHWDFRLELTCSILLAFIFTALSATAGESVVQAQPLTLGIGNQSTVPSALRDEFKVYNIPSGFDRKSRFTGELIQTVIFDYRARNLAPLAGDGKIIGTNLFSIVPKETVQTPSFWRPIPKPAGRRLVGRIAGGRTFASYGNPLQILTQVQKRDQYGDWVPLDLISEPLQDGISAWSSNPEVATIAKIDSHLGYFSVIPRDNQTDHYITVQTFWNGASASVRVLVKGRSLDLDDDGIPNRWEQLFGLNPLNPSDALSDYDNDGLTNLQEFQQGANPLDPDTDHDAILDGADPAPLIPENIPPQVALIAPIAGAHFVKNRPFSIQAQATDNGRVRSIQLLVNGEALAFALGNDVAGMYTPVSLDPVAVQVVAIDFVGNVTVLNSSISVDDAPSEWLIRGRVLLAGGAPAENASASSVGGPCTLTGADGRFELRLPAEVAGERLSIVATSYNSPIPSGAFFDAALPPGTAGDVDIGDLILSPRAFESSLGTRQFIPIGGTLPATLPFPFPFYQGNHQQLSIGGHGAVALGATSIIQPWAVNLPYDASPAALREEFGKGLPVIAPLWGYANASGRYWSYPGYGDLSDSGPSLDHGVGLYTRMNAGEAVISWINIRHGNDSSTPLNSFQARLAPSGEIAFSYSTPRTEGYGYSTKSITGISPGGNANGTAADFSSSSGGPWSTSVSQLFADVESSFALANRGVHLERLAGGDYISSGSGFRSYGETILTGRILEQGVPAPSIQVRLSTGESTFSDALGNFSFLVRRRPIFVAHDATGRNDGGSWTDAFRDLQDALDASQDGDEIWVKRGTYFPSPRPTDNGSTPRFRRLKGYWDGQFSLFGGFAGDETHRYQRDWVNNLTILSGDIGAPGAVNDDCETVIDVGHQSSVLDGFHIINSRNAGIFTVGTVANCVVRRHQRSGVVMLRGKLTRCVVTEVGSNVLDTTSDKAAVYTPSYRQGHVAIESCLIAGNQNRVDRNLANSAGITIRGGNALIQNCTIYGNQALNAAVQRPGAIYVDSGVTVRNCVVASNTRNPQQVSPGVVVTYSCIQGDVIAGEGNSASDPAFVSSGAPAGADGLYLTADDGLALAQGSPCIDSGTQTLLAAPFDLTHAIRINGTQPDRGAYEFGSSRVQESVGPALPQDTIRVISIGFFGSAEEKRLANVAVFPRMLNQLGQTDIGPLPPYGNAMLPKTDAGLRVRGSER